MEAAMMDSGLRIPREEMLRRISGEYLEMPGLRLTCEQAQRLWGLDHDTCSELLTELVRSSFLARSHDGRYARVADGAVAGPRPRMAHATLRAKPFAVKRIS
jgi:hypothetical protein